MYTNKIIYHGLIALVFFSGLVPVCVLASGRVGNGGNVVVCNNEASRPKAVQLLDYYEAEVRKIQIDLGPPDLSVDEKVKIALDRLEKVSPRRARLYREWARSFYDDANFMANINLVNLDDSLNIIVPNGCEIKQIVVQRPPKVVEDRLYTISEDLWKRMDNDEKAGLILHEIIYREALTKFNHTDSFNARYFNSYISSHRVDEYTPHTFAAFLLERGFTTTEIQGVEFDIRGLSFFDNGWVDSGDPVNGEAEINGSKFRVSGKIQFHPNGMIKAMEGQSLGSVDINGNFLEVEGELHGYENGKIKDVQLKNAATIRIRTDYYTVKDKISFYQSGEIENVVLQSPGLFVIHGNEVNLHDKVSFYPNGAVASGYVPHGENFMRHFESDYYRGDLIGGKWIEFYANGLIKQIAGGGYIYDNLNFVLIGELFINGQWVKGHLSRATEDGRVISGGLEEQVQFILRKRAIPCQKEFSLFENGNLEKCQLAKGTFIDVAGSRVKFAANTPIQFSEAGTVSSGYLASGVLESELLCDDGIKRNFVNGYIEKIKFDDRERVIDARHKEPRLDCWFLIFDCRFRDETVWDYPKSNR